MKSVAAALCLILAMGVGVAARAQNAPTTLLDARKGYETKLTKKVAVEEAAPEPPAKIFRLVKYSSDVGYLSAYVGVPPNDGKKHPAIIWLVGGFSSSISEIAWTPGTVDNDQSAAAFREAGIVMMYPSYRGGNDNPGHMESFYGEVNDVIAAAKYLATLDYVDPNRIYLGGHSTGGTLAMLVAESSGVFRAVFAFGPVEDVRGYGPDVLLFDINDRKEARLREPVAWLAAIKNPTFVFEGTGTRSNITSLRAMAKVNTNPQIHFMPVEGASHFTTLRPLTILIAKKILQDDGATTNISFTDAEISAAMR